MMMSLLSSSRGKKRDEATKMIKKTKKSFSFHALFSLSSLSRAHKISLSLLESVCVCVCLVTTFLSLSALSVFSPAKEREESVVLCAFFPRDERFIRHAQLGFRV